MDNKKILLVNLSKGRLGELNSKLLGMIFVMKFQAAAMSRATVPEDQRVDFSLYVDEFQNFSTDSFATILSEARKYHLSLVVANQFTTQLTDEIRDAVFGNIGTIISFRVGTNDAEFLAKYFAPVFDINDLQRVPNHNAIVRMLIGGVPSQSFSMATLPPLGTANTQLLGALKQLSAAKYGRPRAQVESEIFERLKTIEPPKPAFGASPFAQPAPSQGPLPAADSPYGNAPAQAAAKPASFLDDWLSKRNNAPARPVVSPQPFGPPMAAQAPMPAPAPYVPPAPVQMPPAPLPVVQPSVAPVISHARTTLPPHHTAPVIKPEPSKEEERPKEPEAPFEDSKNISSNEIEQKEVDDIAAQLKKGLDSKKEDKKEANTHKETVIPMKVEKDSHLEAGDTIFIDQEGNMTQKDPAGS